MTSRRIALVLIGTLSLAAGACAPPAGGGAIDAEEAVQLVLAQDDQFEGIGPRDEDVIGQAAWYEVEAAPDGWRVVVRIGWGDCPSGCISQHLWTYQVSEDGGVSLTDEEGPPLPDQSWIGGQVLAGPTCPVESMSPDPACAERPVDGAVLVVEDLAGDEVARTSSGADGMFRVDLAPGVYRLVPQPVEGLMGTAPAIEVRVEADEPVTDLRIGYDTGIR